MARVLIDIISDIVNEWLKAASIITAITETSPGVYLIESNSVSELLLNSQKITISDTVGFDGNFLVSNVNYTNNTFNISADPSIAIPGSLGSWISGPVYFYPENVPGYAEHLTNENLAKRLNQKKFPAVFLVTPYATSTKLRNRTDKITRVLLYILNTTEIARKMPWRNINTFPYLRVIKEKLFDGLAASDELVGDITASVKELPFWGSPDQNNLNSVVDAIEIELSDFEILTKNC